MRRRSAMTRVGALVVLLATLVASPAPGGAGGESRGAPALQTGRPNVLLITADDMRESDLRWMPATRRLVERRGVRLRGFLSTHPLCCPARAEILTGQYGHNNGVHHNRGAFGGYRSLTQKGNHLGSWLQSAGYRTALVGKHLNGWEFRRPRQGGWTVFNPIQENVYSDSGLTMYNDGTPRHYPRAYTADVIGRLTVDSIRGFSATESPFFIWASYVPPHGMLVDDRWVPPIPAWRHRALYPAATSPSVRDPAFNEADRSDKPAWVRAWPRQPVARINAIHRARIRSLRSVDEQVEAAVLALEETGELADTIVIFTSDNGFSMGEHRLMEKNHPYEPALRIPLLVRGPGLPVGVTREALFGLVDLAPTIVDLAEVVAGRALDGVSMRAALVEGAPGYRYHLVQGGESQSAWWWRGVRSSRYVFVRYGSGTVELYDLLRDPSQLRNVAAVPSYAAVRARQERRLADLADCQASQCWMSGGPPV